MLIIFLATSFIKIKYIYLFFVGALIKYTIVCLINGRKDQVLNVNRYIIFVINYIVQIIINIFT